MKQAVLLSEILTEEVNSDMYAKLVYNINFDVLF